MRSNDHAFFMNMDSLSVFRVANTQCSRMSGRLDWRWWRLHRWRTPSQATLHPLSCCTTLSTNPCHLYRKTSPGPWRSGTFWANGTFSTLLEFIVALIINVISRGLTLFMSLDWYWNELAWSRTLWRDPRRSRSWSTRSLSNHQYAHLRMWTCGPGSETYGTMQTVPPSHPFLKPSSLVFLACLCIARPFILRQCLCFSLK